MNKIPHKHAALIKQWADGATIECRLLNSGDWSPTNNPGWHSNYEYRVKPEPKPDYTVSAYGYDKRVLDKVMLTFDGETGKLKAVELL